MSWETIRRFKQSGPLDASIRLSLSDARGAVLVIGNKLARRFGWGKAAKITIRNGKGEDAGLLQLCTAAPDAPLAERYSLCLNGNSTSSYKLQLRRVWPNAPPNLPATVLAHRIEADALIVTLPWAAKRPAPAETAAAAPVSVAAPRPAVDGIRTWTPEDDEALRRRWPNEPHEATAVALGRTVKACALRAYKLGIRAAKPEKTPAATPPRGGGSAGAEPPPAPHKAAIVAATPPATPPDAERKAIERYLAEKGATRCPPVYAERVAGAAPLAAPPPAEWDRDRKRYVRSRPA